VLGTIGADPTNTDTAYLGLGSCYVGTLSLKGMIFDLTDCFVDTATGAAAFLMALRSKLPALETAELRADRCLIDGNVNVSGTVVELFGCKFNSGGIVITFADDPGTVVLDSTSAYYFDATGSSVSNGSIVNAVGP
jgi:hypothetical protein